MNDSGDISHSIFSDNYIVPEVEIEEVSDDSSTTEQSSKGTGLLREQDRFLPICNIVKIMKRAIPENGKIAKDARECIQECVSEFISFITSEAIDRSASENRKTVNGDDILFAMATLGFDNYVEPLKLYLHKFRESTKSDRNIVYTEPGYFEDSSSNDMKSPQNDVNDLLRSHTSEDSLLCYQPSQSGNFSL